MFHRLFDFSCPLKVGCVCFYGTNCTPHRFSSAEFEHRWKVSLELMAGFLLCTIIVALIVIFLLFAPCTIFIISCYYPFSTYCHTDYECYDFCGKNIWKNEIRLRHPTFSPENEGNYLPIRF